MKYDFNTPAGLLALYVLALAALVTMGGCRENQPQSDVDLFVAGLAHLDHGEQVDTLTVLIDGEPPLATYASYQLGNILYAEATAKAMDEGWNDPEANALLDSAEHYFDQAIAQDSTFVEALVNLGSLYDDRVDLIATREERLAAMDRAEELYRQALAVEPTNEKARCNLGSLFMRKREPAEALAQFEQVLADHPQSALAHYNLAIMFAESKIYREAIVEWELAAKYDSDGDIGERSRENIKIVKQLQQTSTPDPLTP